MIHGFHYNNKLNKNQQNLNLKKKLSFFLNNFINLSAFESKCP